MTINEKIVEEAERRKKFMIAIPVCLPDLNTAMKISSHQYIKAEFGYIVWLNQIVEDETHRKSLHEASEILSTGILKYVPSWLKREEKHIKQEHLKP